MTRRQTVVLIPRQHAVEVAPASVHYTRNDYQEMSALVL